MPGAGCSRQPLIALAIGVSLLAACATGGSERPSVTVCPPVVEYDQGFLERAAEELDVLPQGSAIEHMLADYAVVRSQIRLCLPK